jgi:Type II secretion system (T2SS), protein M
MRASRWPSEWYRGRSPRERRVIAVGAVVSVAALAAVFVAMPLAARWSAREASIAAKREQLARLDDLIRRQAPIRAELQARRSGREALADRLLAGATLDVAASALQELVQRYAVESDVELGRFDLERARRARRDEDDATPGRDATEGAESGDDPLADVQTIPARITAESDVFGLVALVDRVQNGEKLLLIDEIRINSRTPQEDGRQMLGWSLYLRAPFMTE